MAWTLVVQLRNFIGQGEGAHRFHLLNGLSPVNTPPLRVISQLCRVGIALLPGTCTAPGRKEGGVTLRHGNTLGAGGQKLLDAGFVMFYNFRGAVQAWKDAGFMTADGQYWCTRTRLPRQAQIVADGLL